MGAFFDRSHQTIYNWEKGEYQPDACTQAILNTLAAELQDRKKNQTAVSMHRWSQRLQDEGLEAFLTTLQEQPGRRRSKSCEQLLTRAEEQGGCGLPPGDTGGSEAFVIPLTSSGMRAFLRRVLGSDRACSLTQLAQTAVEVFAEKAGPDPAERIRAPAAEPGR